MGSWVAVIFFFLKEVLNLRTLLLFVQKQQAIDSTFWKAKEGGPGSHR